MNPIAFTIFGLDIRWYGVIIASGMLVALALANYNVKWRNVKFDYLLDAFLIALPFSILGARLYYVLFEFSYYKDNPSQILNTRQGGLAIHGGILFAIISVYFYTRYRKISFLKIFDVAAPSIILAQAIGRWGNFFNGEAHGGEVSYDFIKHFPQFIQKGMLIGGVYYQPTFLYESIWNVSVCIILLYLLRKSEKVGIVFFTYIGMYSIGRFFIEGLRTDSLMLGPLKVAQVVSLSGILLWICALIYYKIKE
ncbi:MAG: lgt [Clostridiaceae bacterium]|jgi:phosphatidylglycerol:prolipoprotein diacylglycerol transferase|nr:lgt [Clostridiaceae bacterium]